MELNSQTVEHIKSKVSILDVISPYVSVIKKGNRHFACCPFHNEKTPSFVIDLVRNRYHCFGCGASGDSINFLMEYNNMSFVDAITELANRVSVEITFNKKGSENYKQKRQEKNELYEIMEHATKFFAANLYSNQTALEYVKSRFLSELDIKDFDIGYSLNSFSSLLDYLVKKGYSKENIIKCGLALEKNGNFYDMFRNRIMFPIKDIKGKVIAFGARSFDGSQPKYINSKETVLFSKKENLYGFFNALKTGSKFTKNNVLIAEGYLDVIKLHKYGFKNSVAPLGTALTEKQVEILSRFSDNHILCFDGDNAGFNAALKTALIYLKNSYLRVTPRFIILPNGSDPDDYLENKGKEQFNELIESSSTLFEFLWQSTVANKSLDNPDTLVYVDKKLKEYFTNITDNNVKQIYINELEKRTKNKRFIKTTSKNLQKVGLNEIKNAKLKQDTIKENILLAYLLKHHYLVDEYIETLCKINIENSLNEVIFGDILNIEQEEQNTLECLANKDYYNYITSKVLSNDILSLEPQINSNDQEEIKTSFEGVLKSFASKELHKEIKDAYSNFLKGDLKSDSHLRLINLKKLQK